MKSRKATVVEQETRANFMITGSIVAIIGFFLPWATLTVPGTRSISFNGSALPGYWTLLVAATIILIIGWATHSNANGFANVVQRLLHLVKCAGALYGFYDLVTSGTLTSAAQAGVLEGSGYTMAGFYTALGTHVGLGYGFWVFVVGLIIGAIGVYAKSE